MTRGSSLRISMARSLAVNPGFVENQITGMLVQATSRILKEEVTFDRASVTSVDWASYPILRFGECPEVTPSSCSGSISQQWRLVKRC